MKIKSLVEGTDGLGEIKAGDIVDRDTEWARRMLANGLAEPLDDHARAVLADPRQMKRYASGALQTLAAEIRAQPVLAAVATGETATVLTDPPPA